MEFIMYCVAHCHELTNNFIATMFRKAQVQILCFMFTYTKTQLLVKCGYQSCMHIVIAKSELLQ